jgi:hypothetical protein
MAEHLWQRFGDLKLPASAGDVSDEQLFSALDPALDRLLALFKTAINVELGGEVGEVSSDSVWHVARRGTVLAQRLPVASTIWCKPTRKVLRERELPYPLLAIYRTTCEHDDLTINQTRAIWSWQFDYILGPLDGADARRLSAALVAVSKIVQLVIHNFGHPEYDDGAAQFFPDGGGLERFWVVSSQQGPASFGQEDEGQEFLALSMVLRSSEIGTVDLDGLPDYDGATYDLDLNSVGGGRFIGYTEVPVEKPKVGP